MKVVPFNLATTAQLVRYLTVALCLWHSE